MSTVPNAGHPGWCDPALCTTDRTVNLAVHRSPAREWHAAGHTLSFGLEQIGGRPGTTVVAVLSYDGHPVGGLSVDTTSAWQLADELTALLEMAR